MADEPRIAFISEHASPVALLGGVDAGGQNVYVDEVARNLGRLGYHVDVFTRWENPDAPEVLAWAPNVRVINLRIGPPRWVFKDRLWPLMPAFRDELCRFMEAQNARYDLIHGNFWMSGWAGLQAGSRLGLPLVQIFHATGKTKRRYQGGSDTSPDDRIAVEYEVVRGAARIIAQCPEEDRELIEDYGADPRRVAVVPSAVNIDTFRPVDRAEARRQIGLPLDVPVIAYIGRMLPRKDPANIVRALALLLEMTDLPVKLLLVGGETEHPDPAATPEIGVLQELASTLGIRDALIFTGRRQPGELRYYYSAADVVVTTPWYEPFGLTPLEAMACGRPVIGSAVGGITFTVRDGLTGLLVPPRRPDVLARQLQYLLERPDVCRRLGLNARKWVEREFTWSAVAARTAALYREVLDEYVPAPLPIVTTRDAPK